VPAHPAGRVPARPAMARWAESPPGMPSIAARTPPIRRGGLV